MNYSLLDEAIKETLTTGETFYANRASIPRYWQRFPLGEIYPENCSIRHNGIGKNTQECLVRVNEENASLSVVVRFLHPTLRTVGSLSARTNEFGPGLAQSFQPLREFSLEGRLFQAGQESVQREVKPAPVPLDILSPARVTFPFRFYASRDYEPIRNCKQQIVGATLHRQEGLEGLLEMTVESAGIQAFKFTVRLVNRTPLARMESRNHEDVLLRTFVSAHIIVRANGAEFVSPAEVEAQ